MAIPITRDVFISPEVEIVAISKKTMYVENEGGEIVEVPIPESIKVTGNIPEGYAVDFFLDPVVVVSALAKSNIITIDQLSDSVLAHLREIINGAGNVTIAPNDVVEEKRNAIEIALKEGAQDSDSDEE